MEVMEMGSQLNVMLVEDESLIAEGLRVELKKYGFSISGIVRNGLDVLREAKEKKPDLILMDINIPGKNGLEVAQQLLIEYPVAVVILTGYSDYEYVKQAAKIGVEGYLLKPVDGNDLKPALEVAYSNFIRKRNLSEELARSKEDLDNRKTIERAKGILMDVKGLKENEAMVILQKKSRNTGRKIIDVAKEIIDAFKKIES